MTTKKGTRRRVKVMVKPEDHPGAQSMSEIPAFVGPTVDSAPEPINTPDPTATRAVERKSATCVLCGRQATSSDWHQLAAWFYPHLHQEHPGEYDRLFTLSTDFLTWLISQTYETDPNWNEEDAVIALKKKLTDALKAKPVQSG